MRKLLFLLLFIPALAFFSCASGGSDEAKDVSEQTVDELAEQLVNETPVENIETGEEAEQSNEPTIESEVEVELEEVVRDEKAEMEQKMEIKKEQLKSSPNLGKSCDDILKDYEDLVDKFLKDPTNETILKQFADWANDPLFNKCKSDPAYADKFIAAEDKMYGEEEF